MHKEYHHWYSQRIERELGVVVYGHWGAPLVAFPTSGGDEWEPENQGMVPALAEFIEAGRIKLFAANAIDSSSFYNKDVHPFHRSYMQAQYDSYVRNELIPFIQNNCQSPGLAVSTMGSSFGAYHAANTLFKHPDVVHRCFAMSGLYDLSRFMDGMYDDNFYFNNPVDYLANISNSGTIAQVSQCDIHIATGSGPWENSGPSYRLSQVLASRGIAHHLDDWGPMGGHDWPYWKHQMREYISKIF